MPPPADQHADQTIKKTRDWWPDHADRAWLLDTLERATMLVLFGWFVVALTSSIITTWTLESNVVIGDLMLLITEAMVIVFVLLRRKAKKLSLRFTDWFLAYSASCLPLLARPDHSVTHFWDGGAVPLTILGLTLILYAKLTLGRRFGLVAANRGICDSGPYRFVRHPIYFGYLLLHIGFLMLSPTVWNASVFVTFYALLIPRIFAEERVLGEDAQYQLYMSKVKSRLIPGFF